MFFEWLVALEEAGSLPETAEERVVWVVQGQLEKALPVFTGDYKAQVEAARRQLRHESERGSPRGP